MLMRAIGIFVSGVALLISYQIYNLAVPPTIPPIDMVYRKDIIKEKKVNVQPFTINISDQVLDDLSKRLSMARDFVPPLKDVAFQYGFNTDYLKKVINFWQTKYKWRAQEKYLNSLPQFKIEIGNLNIHFIHVKPPQTKLKVIPILLLHGWPGSVREFYELIPLLTTPRPNSNFVFEVVAPSLPGYGFSDIPKEKGYNTAVMGTMMLELMSKLGIHRFYVQGGDWGAVIGSVMATLYPSAILGLHSNLCFVNTFNSNLKYILGSFWPSLIASENEVNKMYPLQKHYGFLLEESGYFHIQATKPDTVGVALNDSPIGLAAYILEKFSTWTNRKNREHFEGNLGEKFSLTSLLDNIMIYWVTGTITSSMRLYSEHFCASSPSHIIERHPVTVPSACARFPEEIAYQPEILLQEKFINLTRVSDPPRGGHFAAFEVPELMADDIYESVKIIEQRYYSN
ncbi:juvenile hormone epoxide hydrolase 1-like [Lycorma delicatula]|uniref:juvenile hormone epoxide hydrolase 1-like n=1 Tax=Lycorma delicatula TaxID=130591 RepID=UPI003F510212